MFFIRNETLRSWVGSLPSLETDLLTHEFQINPLQTRNSPLRTAAIALAAIGVTYWIVSDTLFPAKSRVSIHPEHLLVSNRFVSPDIWFSRITQNTQSGVDTSKFEVSIKYPTQDRYVFIITKQVDPGSDIFNN